MMKNLKLFAVLALIVTLNFNLPTKSLAAPVISDNSLYNLADMIEKELDWFKTIGKITGYELDIGGDVEINNNDKFYSILIPNVTIYIRDIDRHLHIGNIAANILQPGKDIWRAKIAIPNIITLTNEFGDIETSINFSNTNLSLIWIPEKTLYPEIQAQFENINILSENSDNILMTIKDISYKSGLNPNQTKDWAGINKMHSWGGGAILEINDLKSVINKNLSLKVEKITNRTEYKQIRPIRIENNRKLLTKFIKENEDKNLNVLDTNEAFTNLIASHQGTKNILNVQGLDFMRLETKTDSIIFKKLIINSEATGIDESLFNIVNNIEFNDLKTTAGFTGDFHYIMPKQGVIPVSFKNIPLRLLKKIFLDEVFALTKKNSDYTLTRIFKRSRSFLHNKNAQASIKQMHIKDGKSYMHINAEARINPKVPYGFSSIIDILFGGYGFVDGNLDALVRDPHVDFGTLISAFRPDAPSQRIERDNLVVIGNYRINLLENGNITVQHQRNINPKTASEIVEKDTKVMKDTQKKFFTFKPFTRKRK